MKQMPKRSGDKIERTSGQQLRTARSSRPRQQRWIPFSATVVAVAAAVVVVAVVVANASAHSGVAVVVGKVA